MHNQITKRARPMPNQIQGELGPCPIRLQGELGPCTIRLILMHTDQKSAGLLVKVSPVVIGEGLSELHRRYVTAAVRVHGNKH